MEKLQNACSTGDSHQLETLLADPKYIAVALDRETQPHKSLPPARSHIRLLLSSAAQSGHPPCVQAFLIFGSDHNVPYDTPPCCWIMVRWSPRLVPYERQQKLRLLIENGGDVNERLMPDAGFFTQKTRYQKASETPLYVATWHRHRDVVLWLLEQGADAEIGDLDGKTPRMIAMEKGDEDLLRVLKTKVERDA